MQKRATFFIFCCKGVGLVCFFATKIQMTRQKRNQNRKLLCVRNFCELIVGKNGFSFLYLIVGRNSAESKLTTGRDSAECYPGQKMCEDET